MKDILREIYMGNCGTYDTVYAGKEYWKYQDAHYEALGEIEKLLKEGEKSLLERVFETEALVQEEIGFRYYREGFRIGLFLGLQIAEEPIKESKKG